ncbi:hypothetical protein Pmani_013170 [Petrolisthes manimaculis]|uniref:Thymidine kinase n=1 Tax=Petrolisthes manimaculis TaxID=1843537 RepID=A0AAE1UCE9_9EUCA|nr:hypothetical protein Pmani_013170 [Petrolisthes manimaculis]
MQVIFGPMFSGKTTELMRRLKRYQISLHKCLVIKYAKDTRYEENDIATHDKQMLPAVATMVLADLKEKSKHYNVIGIDEGQFFPDTVEFCESMANSGKVVVVAALDGTYQRQGFGDILQLVPLAESVVKLTAVCMICYGDAAYTKRTSKETAVEVIGGSEMYIATCRKCYYQVSTPQKRPAPTSPLNIIQESMENCNGTTHIKRRCIEVPEDDIAEKENISEMASSA